MRVAFVVFDGVTLLDLVGVYDPLTRLGLGGFIAEFTWDTVGIKPVIQDDRQLSIGVGIVGSSLAAYDLLVVPGGRVTRQLRYDQHFMNWLCTGATVPLKAAVCTGALLFGAAGFLDGLEATTHPSAWMELSDYCKVVQNARVVDQGQVITCRGVTAGIDLGLYLAKRLAGSAAAREIAAIMDYPYYREEYFI